MSAPLRLAQLAGMTSGTLSRDDDRATGWRTSTSSDRQVLTNRAWSRGTTTIRPCRPEPAAAATWKLGLDDRSAYAGVFIWIPILDRLGTYLPGQTNLGWVAATVVLAAFACCFLLFDIPAMWGWTAGRRLGVVGASTYGTIGSEWITGVLVGLGAIAYYAVSVNMAIRLIMLGLLSCGLIEWAFSKPWRLGPLLIQSPVVLLTALFWIYVITVVCQLRIAGVIFALMQVYTPVALLLLGATAWLASGGLSSFAGAMESLARLDPAIRSQAESSPAYLFQLMFGGFALSGLMGVEWGMAVSKRSEMHIGGWIGIILAGSYCAVMALLTAAGALGFSHRGILPTAGDLPAIPLSFHWAVLVGVGGIKGGVILNLFGLATMATGCYTAWMFRERMSAHWTAIHRREWTRIGGVLAFVLIATSWAGRIEGIFNLLGAIFAPAIALWSLMACDRSCSGTESAAAGTRQGCWPGA